MKHESVGSFLSQVALRNPGQPEFLQAVTEVMESLWPFIEQNPRYAEHGLLERLVEPERTVMFRVSWVDDHGSVQVNRGYRIQHSMAIGPYKGGLRFHPSVNLSVLKFLAFEQTFKNALTTLPMGGGKGGSDFDPKGKSPGEVMRFCQAFVSELFRHVGSDTDVPAGDIGVGGREVGYMAGMYKKLSNRSDCVFTGKGLSFGGSLIRPEATGYGTVYFADEMLKTRGRSFDGLRVSVSGSGNVAQYAVEKAMELGAKVITVSDSSGTIVDEDGFTPEKLAILMDVKNHHYGRVSDYAARTGVKFEAGVRPWHVKVDVALPCATQNELDEHDAATLIKNGVLCVAEGANMPSTIEAAKAFEAAGVLYAPGKASNAGGVATSGLEMSQNSARLSWPREEVDARLLQIMQGIHAACLRYGKRADGSDELHRRRQHCRLCEGGRRHAGTGCGVTQRAAAQRRMCAQNMGLRPHFCGRWPHGAMLRVVTNCLDRECTVEIFSFLNVMVEKGGSDLFFSVGAPVNLKIEGVTHPLKMPALLPGQVKQLAYAVMNEKQISEFEARQEMNLSISAENLGRFRVNVFVQRGETGMVVRYIKNKIPPLAALGLPPILEKLVLRKRGLVLVTGATGSGKSTTLASMINYRNENVTGHILTIEDPLEFLHAHKRSVVDQREVGIDTHSYEEALKNALREAPDVIMIGEVRDRNTMKQAIAFAETGHLCLTTLHANNANQAMERVINFFPEDAHHQLLMDLSLNLAGVVSQRLIPGLHEKLVPAVEVMLNSPYIADLIGKGEFASIKETMGHSTEIGMCTFDQALYQLYTEGRISLEEALHNADSRTDLALRVRLAAGVSAQDAGDLSIDTSSPMQSASRLY